MCLFDATAPINTKKLRTPSTWQVDLGSWVERLNQESGKVQRLILGFLGLKN